jgi:hypothetical protein
MQRRDLAHLQVLAKILVSRNSPRFRAFSMCTLQNPGHLWEFRIASSVSSVRIELISQEWIFVRIVGVCQ